MKNQNSQNYFVGLDIGTNSVGYAVTTDHYDLCKHRGEPMWGVTLFDETESTADRRGFRTARRRLDRRQQRVKLVQELFAKEIGQLDENFFKRIKESYLYPESKDEKIRLFDSYEAQKAYTARYPTIHHLIVELIRNPEPHDVRLVYLACAWLVAHRGHFLSEVDRDNIEGVIDFNIVYKNLTDFLTRDNEYSLPWKENVDLDAVKDALKSKKAKKEKEKRLKEALFSFQKCPEEISENYEYNYSCVIKLLCGGTVELSKIFGKEEYDALEEKKVALNMEDERLATIKQSIDDDDAEMISVSKAVYDWSVLVDILDGYPTLSEAKVTVYEKHKQDLKDLKYFTNKYVPEKYNEIFRKVENKDKGKVINNYVAYIGGNKTKSKTIQSAKTINQSEFCKYIKAIFQSVTPDEADREKLNEMLARLEDVENSDFMPKQVTSDNRVIPYQLYWTELKSILDNAQEYIPFLKEPDEDGITGAKKILYVFTFKIPYYVGPLKESEKDNAKYNHWMVRKAAGKIYPWNFEQLVDLDKSEEAFISRMTNSCTYLPGEEVLPKNSLLYSAFEVLNEINNIKIDSKPIPVSVKQEIFNELFMNKPKVTFKQIRDYLLAHNYMQAENELSGLDTTVKSSLKPFWQFRNLVSGGRLTYRDVEKIIRRATYSEDKGRFSKWLKENYPHLPEEDIIYISKLKFKDFGRLSKKLLCDIYGVVDRETGESMNIIHTMWETNYNFMQCLSDQNDFKKNIDAFVQEYYDLNPKSVSEQLDEMYVSNSVKRPIIRTLDILKDVVAVQGDAPKRIFIEMARGVKKEPKSSRLEQIQEIYSKIKDDTRELQEQLDALGEDAVGKLQSDRIFLYFLQLGRCLYTSEPIPLEALLAGHHDFNIEHIYPQSFVKDDSLHNIVLVNSKVNGEKNDEYPIKPDIQNKMRGFWEHLRKIGTISDEKFKRLTRTTPFTDEERFEFINRQLVETQQSTKALATLLKKQYPKTEIVYVKAGLVTDFRQEFDVIKSRAVNDLHHAKDAYLNIVAGNVWYCKYSRQFWKDTNENSAKIKTVFTHPVVCNGETIWTGKEDKNKVCEIAKQNTAHLTKYAFCRKGGFFDQQPVPKDKGLAPLKKDRPTEIYGGYNGTTASFFVLVRYKAGKKQDVMVMPVELLYADKFRTDENFAVEYAKQTITAIINKKNTPVKTVETVEFLLNKRILRVNTVLSLNGFRVCITKKNDENSIGLKGLTTFKTSLENEQYIKKLESFDKKQKENSSIKANEKFDGISKELNNALYDYYIDKLQNTPYKYRPGSKATHDKLAKGREKFQNLSPEQQVSVLLSIQGLFGQAVSVNLSSIAEQPVSGSKKDTSVGQATLNVNLSNWKKDYTDVRIIDQSASGLFEKVSENLLDLL